MMTGEIATLPVLIGELTTSGIIEAEVTTEIHITAGINSVESMTGELSLPSFHGAESEVF